jgi:phosphoribosylglycinamide formyltransferase-1
MSNLNIAVLASGRGSNFQSIIDSVESGYLKNVTIRVLVTDNPDAFALSRATKHGIEHIVMTPKQFGSRDLYDQGISDELTRREIGLVVLAGYMRIVGMPLIEAFRNRIMNIHPALLPSFPGLHGQKQAIDYGVKISGCTVHFVDGGMDTGPVIMQAAVPARHDDTEESLAARILMYEHRIYPDAIRLFSEGRVKVAGRKVIINGALTEGKALISPVISD